MAAIVYFNRLMDEKEVIAPMLMLESQCGALCQPRFSRIACTPPGIQHLCPAYLECLRQPELIWALLHMYENELQFPRFF
jgi:hypothetical protein